MKIKKHGTRGLGRVYLRGNVFWISYYFGGKKRRESSGSEKEPDAVALLKRRFEECGKGRPAADAQKVLLSDLKALIDSDYQLNGRRSAKRLGQSWRHLEGFFGEKERATAVTASRLSLYVTRRTDDGAAPATVKNELAALKRAFTLAKKSGTLLPGELPAAFPTISPANAREGFMERAQHEAIKAALPSDEADLVEFLYWTAWRKSEALGLRWSDVDRGAGVIRISRTKNGTPRTLPYGSLPVLKELIEHRRTLADATQKKREMVVGHVFSRNGDPIRYFRRSWISACIAAGLGREVKNEEGKVVERVAYRLVHDLRRSAARNMLRAGVPQRVAMEIGGWKTASVFTRYAITDEAVMAEGLARLGQARPSIERGRIRSIRSKKRAQRAESGLSGDSGTVRAQKTAFR